MGSAWLVWVGFGSAGTDSAEFRESRLEYTESESAQLGCVAIGSPEHRSAALGSAQNCHAGIISPKLSPALLALVVVG